MSNLISRRRELRRSLFLSRAISIAVIPFQLLSAAACHGTWFALFPVEMLSMWTFVIHCNDRDFGNGRKYHYVRQTIFGTGIFAAILLALLP